MIRYFGILKTLGIKYTLWKIYLISRKKLRIEKLLSKKYTIYDTKIKGIIPADLFEKRTFSHTFFSNQNKEEIITSFSNLPESIKSAAKKQTIKIIEENQVTFFSGHKKKIEKIDFNYDYFENVKWKVGKHSSTYFQYDGGDLKKVWELNRLQFLNPLLTGYLTADKNDKPRIKNHLVNQLLQWFKQNPYNRSVAWACSQETAIRSFNLIFYYWLFDLNTEEELHQIVPNYLFLAVEKIYKHINFARAQRNNHAITEAMFLIVASKFFKTLPKAEKYYQKGINVLLESVKDQFFNDGTYIQNSHTYHRFALQSILVVFALLEEDNNTKETLEETIKKSYLFLKACISNTKGDFPNYGPNDGALLFNWGNNEYRNLYPLLNLMGSAIGAKETFGGQKDEIDNIILKIKSKSAFKTKAITDFSSSGFYILENEDFKIHFRCGSYIKRYPSQCDMLHADIWYKGKNILADSGTYEYYSKNNPGNFIKFLSTNAHNTVKIANLDQMEKGPRFTWLSSLRSKLIKRTGNSITGEHYGYLGRVNKDTVHRRQIVLDNDGIKVIDLIRGGKNKPVALFWNFGDFSLAETGKNVYELLNLGIQISFQADLNFKTVVEETPKSFYYSQQVKTPAIKLSFQNKLEQLKITTVIQRK